LRDKIYDPQKNSKHSDKPYAQANIIFNLNKERPMRQLLLLPLIMTLSSCVMHLSQGQCLTTNWKNEGFNDGTVGKPIRDLSQAAEDCMKFGIPVNVKDYALGWRQGARQYCTPDFTTGYMDGTVGKADSDIFNRTPLCMQANIPLKLTAYNRGRQQGLLSFCTYSNGFDFARQGKLLPDVCPPKLRAQFAAGWVTGREQFCTHPKNGFALGKASKTYPELCDPSIFPAFRSEYSRGLTMSLRMNQIQDKISQLNVNISDKARQYSLRETGTGHYEQGNNKSPEAANAMTSANEMVKEKQSLDAELFSLQVMK